MDYLSLFLTVSLLLSFTLYWFFYLFGAAEVTGKPATQLQSGAISPENVRSNYRQYASFFKNPTQYFQTVAGDQVPLFVDTFYNLVTDIYEWGWGQSFHFSPTAPGRSHREDTRVFEAQAVDSLLVGPGDRIVDVGCGVGGPMRAIAAHSEASVVGITINEYQVQRARAHNKKSGLDRQCEVVCGNFLQMPFEDSSFDGAYSIEATCHAPKLEEVYREVFRVLKPGGRYFSSEWVTTDLYDPKNEEHVEIIEGIERGNALPGLRTYKDVTEVARRVGFEVVKEEDFSKPPRGPWWLRLKMGRVAYWRNHVTISVLAALRIAPKGVVDVHKMLYHVAHHLTRGGESGIFTPMYVIVLRKPVVVSS